MLMAERKVDSKQILELHDAGLGVSEIARQLGLNKSTVSRYLKRMRINVVKQNLQLAREIGAEKRNLAEELTWHIDKLRADVTWMERTVPAKNTEEYREWLKAKRDHYGEMRRTAETIGNLAWKMFQAEQINEAIEIILEEVSRESRETAERILRRLETRRNIRFPHLSNAREAGPCG